MECVKWSSKKRVTALSNVEAKKRFEFLEAVSGTMDAHLRYFKQGYELLHQMEPYINQGSGSQISAQRNSSELGHGLLSHWLSSHHYHGGGGVHDEKSVAHHTVNLLTSTIKVDVDQSDLRFCFRTISPKKTILSRRKVPWIKWTRYRREQGLLLHY
ncbi:ADP-ribosylation factor GTPase-activating protein AGD3 [Artemisia annua]|uniref:ADP-ribosylation factor GTPase-activating protein AGD3 n=1 Tax=Artemisia annua TaxID=35608 RepID=A0A2U1NM74_ARTAN|nr:ADP-ribosylation factor GTPase-activating protein AGD3 [Artemisia annua]